MEIVITPNETSLIKEHQTLNLPCLVENMSVGDAIIRHKESKDIRCIIERKTVKDLWNSFRDGRYNDQKRRLKDVMMASEALSVIYLIEGSLSALSPDRQNPIRACLHSLQCTGGFVVHRTTDIGETVKLLDSLVKFYEKEPTTRNVVPMKVGQLKHKPSDLLTPGLWAVHALTLIPQMSITKSQAVLDKFDDIPTLTERISSEEHLCELANIQVEGKRKIGMMLAKRIRDYLMTTKKNECNTLPASSPVA